jgi:hypothetical protein
MQAQAQQTITDSVLKHTQALCEALTQNYIDYSIRGHQSSKLVLMLTHMSIIKTSKLMNSKQVNAIIVISSEW